MWSVVRLCRGKNNYHRKQSEKKKKSKKKNPTTKTKILNGKKQHRSNHRFPQGEWKGRAMPSLSSYLIGKESVTQ
jgi:hypothetical protein